GRRPRWSPVGGGQYPTMLAACLSPFPGVRELFAGGDRLSLGAGHRAEPISRRIFVSESLADAEQTAAEKELWRLGNAVSSILISEWALYLLLRGMGLRPDVVGRHTARGVSAPVAARVGGRGAF